MQTNDSAVRCLLDHNRHRAVSLQDRVGPHVGVRLELLLQEVKATHHLRVLEQLQPEPNHALGRSDGAVNHNMTSWNEHGRASWSGESTKPTDPSEETRRESMTPKK